MWVWKTPGIPDEMFEQREGVPGPTKEEVRVLTVSKARLRDGSVVFDVGCGTGGLTVEAALQVAPTGRVFAIDDDERAIELTAANAARFALGGTVQLIKGSAPEALYSLPEASAILVGGSRQLRGVLSAAYEKLISGGRIVVNAILLETACSALGEMRKLGFKEVEVVSVSVAKGKAVESGTMMLARNPITIISGTK
ncbi:MAG: precorrin-6Y C5,15-methyltransferase (decarboxylating) subunit CbiT [Candidatus Verstraetearchaeota archaeon]|nr:precorrin-6Y C5,15-methyltransferase (decarboxylating) subunit CbiT [Candidatus Verstraetearchaeota archaeon]